MMDGFAPWFLPRFVATARDRLRRGAGADPSSPATSSAEEADTLRVLVRRLARVPAMRHVAGHRANSQSFPPPPAVPAAAAPFNRLDVPVLGVAASAGGPAAVKYLVSRLAPDFEGCIAVVQHLLPGFAASLVEFLRAHTRLRVQLALGPTRPSPATVLVAPDHRHLVLSPAGTFALSESPAGRGYRPAADVLFRSLAETCGPNALGVVLSGIGDDGAAGLLAMRRAGAATIAQDQASSVVFGMPRAAQANGAASHVLALEEIPAALTHCVKQLVRKSAALRP
jgi:two-component system chemotaxis response regulator CheB